MSLYGCKQNIIKNLKEYLNFDSSSTLIYFIVEYLQYFVFLADWLIFFIFDNFLM